MVRLVRAGCPTAFTIDGPRGPRYVAKMGPVLLAKKWGRIITIASINGKIGSFHGAAYAASKHAIEAIAESVSSSSSSR